MRLLNPKEITASTASQMNWLSWNILCQRADMYSKAADRATRYAYRHVGYEFERANNISMHLRLKSIAMWEASGLICEIKEAY